jgi:hypothetical protein
MAFVFSKNRTAEFFFRAFKDCVDNIVHDLPNDSDMPQATHAIQILAQQLNSDYSRLIYVNEVIQRRIWEDDVWAASAAVDVYEMLAIAIDPGFSSPKVPMTGAYLVRNELMKSCQTQFQHMVTSTDWSRGLINFLGQLCTTGKITSTTPGIVLHILDSMVSSTSLMVNNNFDILATFLMLAGPYLDGQVDCREHLTARLKQLQQQAQSCKVSDRLAVYGLTQLRERSWPMEAMEAVAREEQHISEEGLDWVSIV